jgi:hypothetical protein
MEKQPGIGNGENAETGENKASLSERLGFKESLEMLPIRSELLEALQADDQSRVAELAANYRKIGETIADSENRASMARLGMELSFAQILLEAGKVSDYREFLEETLYIAQQEGYANIAAEIEELLKALE